MMCSTHKLNKQGENKQLCRTPFSILNQLVVPYRVLTVVCHTVITQWSYEPYHIGPSKMRRSQWRVLTKHVPLEDGIANHSSILAVRTPVIPHMGFPGVSECESRSVVSDSLWPHGLYSPWNSPGQNTGVGSLSLLQGIFPAQGSNPGLHIAGRFFTSSVLKNPSAL